MREYAYIKIIAHNIYMAEREIKTLAVTPEAHELLGLVGRKHETYSAVIVRLCKKELKKSRA